MKELWKEFFIKWQQACYVCFPMMVQGDLTALTWSHWWKANCTGIIAGVGAVFLRWSYFQLLKDRKWFHGVQLGLATFIADLLVHPSHFGSHLGEALATAVGAGLLATFFAYNPNLIPKIKDV